MKRIVVLAVLAALACNRSDKSPEPAPLPSSPDEVEALAGFAVRADDEDLLFQYYDEGKGRLEVAKTVDDVPEGARENVIVLSRTFRKGDLPAGIVLVANLTTPNEDGSYPYRIASRYKLVAAPTAADSPAPAPAASGDDEVLLFTTKWCPHCRRAKQWLAAHDVPFEELDVEASPAARQRLMQLGKQEGIPASMLGSVPVLYVKGKLLLGFNEAEVARLLGK